MRSLFIIILIFICYSGSAQIINFPDPNFKKALVNTKCVDTDGVNGSDADADLNNDGEIDKSEVLKVESLILWYKSISNLDGIEYFENLRKLDCQYNKLTALDVSKLTNLISLNCLGNQIDALNLTGLTTLTSLNCSLNKISSLLVKENKNLFDLRCHNNLINSLDVQGLTKLNGLSCGSNQLKYLDVQGLLELSTLDCSNNLLTSLNLNGLPNLNFLYCGHNQIVLLDVFNLLNLNSLFCASNKLTLMDVTNLKNLKVLSCSSNQLESLKIYGLKNLEKVYCDTNQLTSLNLNGLTNLKQLYCASNQLQELQLFGLDNLINLDCNNNELTNLSVMGLRKLINLRCYNNKLINLFIKTSSLTHFDFFSNNPNLSFICCNESDITKVKDLTLIYNNLNCEVNSYCSFTPGGTFYILNGENTYDGNNNGCDNTDTNLAKFKYKITNGNISGTFISNSTGNYSIPVQEGTHTITPILEYPDHFEVSPSSYTVTFPHTSDTITQNFCITPKGILRQTNITVIPLTPPARPGFDASYKIVWENVGNQIESGTLNFTYDETLLDYISATQTADQVADGIVKWNFSNLLPFEKREITVTLKVNRPTDTPAVNAGDKLYLTASILDNIFTLENTVVGSYDPNDKTCLQGDRVHPDMIGKYVDYLIRFENTGTYAAENVVVKDIIDTKRYDVSTLQITDASHEVYTRIEGNKVEFIFENIQLPFDDANNDGYIAFKIKTLPTLQLGDSLKNLADIYFDYNFPIRTNEAQTTVALPSFTQDWVSEINVYPNPVTDILHLQTDETWTKAEIFDVSGRIMRAASLNGQSIDVSTLESGTYFVRLRNGDRIGRVKFVKM